MVSAHNITASVAEPSSPEKTLITVLEHMEELVRLFEEEKNAFELRDMTKFSDIQFRKNKVVSSCEHRILGVQTNPSILRSAPAELKSRIAATQAKIDILAEESKRDCKIRAESMVRIQNRLLDAARQVMERNKTQYNARGQKTFMEHSRPIATAWNEAI